jgi:hypothetical protein
MRSRHTARDTLRTTPRRCGAASALWVGVVIGLMSTAFAADASGAASKDTTAGPCGVPGARVVRRSPHTIVVRQPVRSGPVRARYWACLASLGVPVQIGVEDDEFLMLPDKFAFAGRYLAAVQIGCLAECAEPWVLLFDLRARRRVRYIERDASNYESIAKVVVGTRGGVAVLEQESARRIRVWRRGKRAVIVARGSYRALPMAPFTAHGNLLRWRDQGRARSYRL